MPNGGAPARPFSPFRRRRFGLTIVTAFGTVLGSATRRSDCRIRRTTPGAHRDPCRSRSALMLRAQECTSQRPLIKCETARVNASHLVRELMDAATARARASLTFLPLGPDSIAVSAGGRIMPDSGGAPFHMPNPMHDRSAVCAARHLSHSATRRDKQYNIRRRSRPRRSLRCPSHGGALLCPHAARARPFAHGFRCDWLSSPRMPFGAALRRCMLDPSTQDPETSRSIRNFLRVHYKCAHAASGGLGERRTLSCSCGHRSASPTAWACASCRSRGKTS